MLHARHARAVAGRARTLARTFRKQYISTGAWSLVENLVDLDRYPILPEHGPARAAAVAHAQKTLENDGICILPGFMHPHARQAAAAEAAIAAPHCYVSSTRHNVFLERDPSSTTAPLRALAATTDVGSIASDELSPTGPLRSFYSSEHVLNFVRDALGIDGNLYHLADPLGAVTVNVFRDGMAHAWHFDEAEFTCTLMLQEAQSGGLFELVPKVRSLLDDGCSRTEQAISELVTLDRDGVDQKRICAGTVSAGPSAPIPQQVMFGPGALSLFHGSRSLHRVTRMSGQTERYVGVLCYSREPGVENSSEVRKMFWGREG